jgi:hypothetical protein
VPAAPARVPEGAPTAAAASKGLVAPATGLMGALTVVATKGEPAQGWGRATMMAPAMVHAGAPATATAPTACSREAAAA